MEFGYLVTIEGSQREFIWFLKNMFVRQREEKGAGVIYLGGATTPLVSHWLELHPTCLGDVTPNRQNFVRSTYLYEWILLKQSYDELKRKEAQVKKVLTTISMIEYRYAALGLPGFEVVVNCSKLSAQFPQLFSTFEITISRSLNHLYGFWERRFGSSFSGPFRKWECSKR